MRRNAILFLLASLFCGNCFSQQYPFIHYTPKDGLVNNRARFIFQDRKGLLYISTFCGLSVYDGSRFTNDTASLLIYCADSDSTIFIDLIHENTYVPGYSITAGGTTINCPPTAFGRENGTPGNLTFVIKDVEEVIEEANGGTSLRITVTPKK